jgi:uncharacterized protein (DUF1800 family)
MNRLAGTVALTALLIVTPSGPRPAGSSGPAAGNDSTTRAKALHLLDRITYGPRPGDVDRVVAMGIDRYIDQQLHPERIPDEPTARMMQAFPVLRTSTRDLAQLDQRVRRENQARQRAMGDSARPVNDPGNAPPPPPNSSAGQLRRLVGGLQQATVVRAAKSERQLYEVMVDFWTNHFNVYMAKGIDRVLMPSYIEETIRPRALGKFEDLLVATAQSPAMMFYLDNAQSVTPGAEPPGPPRFGRRGGFGAFGPRRGFGFPPAGRGARARGGADGTQMDSTRPPPPPRPTGINENYARELMELHTLGVDGGYTQQDVINVARILTGWGIQRGGGEGVAFEFKAWAHDTGEKVVLGQKFPAGRGMDEGFALLKLLANHPSTMRHVSAQLCQRLVSDDPPDGCIDAGVHAWQRTHGDMREVVGAIIRSPEFWALEYRGAKTKTPLEFVVSAMRAINASPDTLPALAQAVARLGQPLFLDQPPTGYPETQESWVNAGALLARFNIAMALASGRMPGTRVDLAQLLPGASDGEALASAVNRTVLNGKANANTLRVLKEQVASVDSPETARILAVALALGSPEFQRQ